MAETFPVAFGAIGLQPRLGLTYLTQRSGLLITGRQGQAAWSGPLTTGKLTKSEHADLFAFVMRCLDENLRVDFVAPRYRVPRAYSTDTWPLEADLVLVSTTDLNTIVVSGGDLGLQLRRGDRFTLMQDELRCYRMVAEDVEFESVLAQPIKLTPRLPIGVFAPAAAVRFIDPMVRLALLEEGTEIGETFSPAPVTIQTMESLA